VRGTFVILSERAEYQNRRSASDQPAEERCVMINEAKVGLK
jgi:hypothetical protein